MIIYINAPFTEKYKSALTTTGAVRCLERFHQVFAKTDEDANNHWYVCDNQQKLLQFQVALARGSSRFFDCSGSDHGSPKRKSVFEVVHSNLGFINDALRCYLQFIKLDGYEHPCQRFAEEDFKYVVEYYSPVKYLSTIHTEITTNDISSLDVIAGQLTYSQFEEWCDRIALSCFSAYLAYVIHQHLCRTTNSPFSSTGSEEMVMQISEVMEKLYTVKEDNRIRTFLPNRFTGISQSELTLLIDGYMAEWDNKPMQENQKCAQECGAKLDEAYPAYEWCVIIAEDNSKLQNFFINADDQSKLWLQESTHFQTVPLLSVIEPYNYTIYSKGDEYGMITCGKKVTLGENAVHRRRLTVFWRRPNGHPPLSFALFDLLKRVDVMELAPANKKDTIRERNVYRNAQQDSVEDVLFGSNCDYVVCMGLQNQRTPDELGIYVTQSCPS